MQVFRDDEHEMFMMFRGDAMVAEVVANPGRLLKAYCPSTDRATTCTRGIQAYAISLMITDTRVLAMDIALRRPWPTARCRWQRHAKALSAHSTH